MYWMSQKNCNGALYPTDLPASYPTDPPASQPPTTVRLSDISSNTVCPRGLEPFSIFEPLVFSNPTLFFLVVANVISYDMISNTACPRSLDPFYIVAYCIKWVKTFWTYSNANYVKSLFVLILSIQEVLTHFIQQLTVQNRSRLFGHFRFLSRWLFQPNAVLPCRGTRNKLRYEVKYIYSKLL